MNDLRLNKNLQPLDSPVARNQGAASSYEFDSRNERNAVNLTKIKNFSFSQGFGGTLTLGGAGNGNGLMLVKDANGSTVVRADNQGINIFGTAGGTIVTLDQNGIIVDGGNILVKNENNTTIIDTEGIVSTANFVTDQVFSNVLQSTASSTAVDVTGSSLAPFTLARSAKVLVTMTAFGYNNNFDSDGEASLAVICNDSVDGDLMEFPVVGAYALADIDIDFVGESWSWTNNINIIASTMNVYQTLSAGTHTLKMQYYANSSGTARLVAFLLNYMILGS